MSLEALKSDIDQLIDVMREDHNLDAHYKKFIQFLKSSDSEQELGKKVIQTIDPETLKNHPRLLNAVQIFLKKHPEMAPKVTLQGSIQVHELLLKAACAVRSDRKEAAVMPDLPSNLVSIFKQFIETGEISGIHDENMVQVLEWSHRYEMMDLEDISRDFIFANLQGLQKQDLLELFKWAKEQKLGYLQMACMHAAKMAPQSSDFCTFARESGIDFGNDLTILHADQFSLVLHHNIKKDEMEKMLEWFDIVELKLEGVGHHALIEILDLLETNKTVKKLYMDEGSHVLTHRISVEEELAKVLLKNSTLEQLFYKVHTYYLKSELLAEGFRKNSTLTHFDLAYAIWTNDFEAFPIFDPELLKVLMASPSLTHLRLSRYRFENEFTFSNKLENLNLEHSFVSELSAKSLLQNLKGNSTLFVLNIRDTALSNTAAIDLAEALRANNSLKNLDLSSNALKDEGMQEIAAALGQNTGLISLSLARNEVGEKGTLAFAESLKSNRTLEELNLEQTGVHVPRLEAALKHNRSLKTLNIRSLELNEEILESIERIQQANPYLSLIYDQINWMERAAKEVRPFGPAYAIWSN